MEPAVGSRQLAREVGALGHRSLWRDAVVRVEELRQRGIEPSAVAFNALVSALARGHRVERSAALLRDLRREELHLDLEAYGGAITACADAALWAEALGFLEEVLHSELLEDSALFNQALASCWRGHWRLAQALLSRMDSHALPRTVVSFEKAAAACSRAGRWQEAFYLFEEAWESLCPPNALMFRDVSRSCADGFAWEASLELLNLACRDDAPEVEDSACAAALGACGSASRWELVFTLLAESWEVGDPGGEAYSAAIRGLSRCSQWPHALLALAELRALRRTPDAAAFGELVRSAVEAAAWREALLLQQEHLDPAKSGPPPGTLNKAALSKLLALWEAKGLVQPQCRLLCRLGDAVRARRDAARRKLNRPLSEVQVANAVGAVLGWRTELQARGLPPQAAKFARRLRDAMQQEIDRGASPGALPYQKDLNLLSHVVSKVSLKSPAKVSRAAAICEVLEQVAQKRWRRDRLWIDMPGGEKAALCATALRGAVPGQVLEIGTSCGYSSLRFAIEFPELRIHSIEEDVLRVAIARCHIAMAELSSRIEVWLGNSAEVIPRLTGTYSAVFLDADGSRYLQQLQQLEEKGRLSERALVVANHALKPGAPELLCQLRHFAVTQVISVPEFPMPHMPLEDWISVSVLSKSTGALPLASTGVRQLEELSENIRSRANDLGSRKASKALDDWKQFVESMKQGFAKEGVVPTAIVAPKLLPQRAEASPALAVGLHAWTRAARLRGLRRLASAEGSSGGMKAVTVSKYGDATQVMEITDVEKPTAAAGQVLVKNMAIATNPIDYKAAAGVLAPGAEAPDKRLIVGWDCAGVVEQAGEGVTDFQAGDNVWFAGDITKDGCFAEYTTIDARLISKKPESMSFEDAAALPLTFQTAWEGLVEQMNVQKGKTIFVLNGAGGLGSIVIQLAKHLGLTVIASASREETVSWCKKMGADHIINHRNELKSQLAEAGYPSVDYLFNAHENDRLGELIQLLSVNGKIAITFNATREQLETVDFQTMWMKRQSLVHTFMFGRAMFDASPEMVGGIMASCAKLVDSGIIKSTATTKFKSLTEIKEAIKVQMSGKAMGKIVLSV